MRAVYRQLIKPSYFKRFLFFFLSDTGIVALSLYLSFLLRFDFNISREYEGLIPLSLPLFIIVKLAAFTGLKMQKMTWRYVGIGDLYNISFAVILSEIVLLVLIRFHIPLFFNFFLSSIYSFPHAFPRSIFIIDAMLSFIMLSGLRVSKRLYIEIIQKTGQTKKGKRTVIIGAGNTGEMILRDMTRQASSVFHPVALLDDDERKIGSFLHGVKIYGKISMLNDIIARRRIEAVIIAIPSLSYKGLRKIYDSAGLAGIGTVKIVPRIYDLQHPDINIKDLEDISIEDLIGRQIVEVDYEKIGNFLRDKTILITGAGGSIGSEIVIQACSFQPSRIILLDVDETELHTMEMKIKKIFPHWVDKICLVVGDIRDSLRIREIFKKYQPMIVFHAAAYKHVPMMEYNPKEAVKVNLFGTYNIAKIALESAVEKFVMISTDKAVMPTSIMGATKRMAEHICRAYNEGGKTEFISVRFGNVLGSRGSVLPLFLEQLKYGGPLTITHKDMRRYFMTIPEAVSLVLQASVIGKGGEVLVLDMGEPVRIVDLAEELIRIHGLEPYQDINIEFVGLRPGEKLFEEILTAEEGTTASIHKKIFTANCNTKYSIDEIEMCMQQFKESLLNDDENSIGVLLRRYVKHYIECGRK